MHSSHLPSVYIHHNGDYSGDFLISDYPLEGDNCKTISFSGSKFFKIAKDLIEKKKINCRNKLDVVLNGRNEATGKPDSIQINSKDIVDLYLEKLRSDEISELEQMAFAQLLKRYSK